jgi:hypothetical protein
MRVAHPISGVLPVAAALLFAACSSDDNGMNGTMGDVAMVTVTPTTATLTYGDQQSFTAAVTDADGNPLSVTPGWSVSDPDLGTISSNGTLTVGVQAPLTEQVIASADGVQGMATVNVTDSQISFATDLLPVFQGGCAVSGCHSAGSQASGLDLSTRAGLLAGGNNGAAVVPGSPGTSIVIQKLLPNPPFGSQMPRNSPGSYPQGWFNKLWAWIQQGAQDNAASSGPDR